MKMKKFIGDIEVKKIEDLFTTSQSGVFIVVGWFVSIVEGVDMWFPRIAVSSVPRFRMKVKVMDGDRTAVLSLFDDDVETLAMETCPFMKSMGESCSTFPDEMECYYGDVDVVNEFIDQYFLDVESISTISTHPIEKKIPKPVVLDSNGSSVVFVSRVIHGINSQIQILPSYFISVTSSTVSSIIPLPFLFLRSYPPMETYAIQQLRRYGALLSIDPPKNDGEFKVKVMKKWITKDVMRMGRIVSVDMILVDQTGHKIQATIPENLCSLFDKKILEGKVYIMSNFTIRSNMGQHLASFHRNMLVFNDRTNVKISWGLGFPSHGLDLIASNDVLTLKDKFQYLVDVIGVVTYIRHDKNIFLDGTTTKTVTLKLTDNKKCSNTFECELFGEYVDIFRELMKENGLGLPVVALQWVKVTKSQGRNVVQSVDGITKIYINPTFYEAMKFKEGLVTELNRKRKTLGVLRRDKPIGFSFTTHFNFKSISQLREDPTLGIYLINARIKDIIALDTWWYPVCGCDLIIEDYLGAFFVESAMQQILNQ
ncbi:replication factor A protein [Trifolium repens]|nr:replication factor A protein [Trifolium repens]